MSVSWKMSTRINLQCFRTKLNLPPPVTRTGGSNSKNLLVPHSSFVLVFSSITILRGKQVIAGALHSLAFGSELHWYLMRCSGFGARRVFDAMFWHMSKDEQNSTLGKKYFEIFGLKCVLTDSESISNKNFFRKFSLFCIFGQKSNFLIFLVNKWVPGALKSGVWLRS